MELLSHLAVTALSIKRVWGSIGECHYSFQYQPTPIEHETLRQSTYSIKCIQNSPF